MPTLAFLIALVSAEPRQPAADVPAIERLAPRAAGVCLAEIIETSEHDARGNDGSLYVAVKLRLLRSSGQVEKELSIIKEQGGLSPAPSREPPKPVLSIADAQRGGRWWLAFASRYDKEPRNPHRLMGAWPQSDAAAGAAFEAAIRDDHYRWMPQFDSETGFTICHLTEPSQDAWKLRLEKDGKALWEKNIPDKKTRHYFDLQFYGKYEGFPSHMPTGGKTLVVPTLVQLAEANEFNLAAGQYKCATALDPAMGNRLAVYLFRMQPGYEKVLYCDYEPTTGKLLAEDRFVVVPSGGKALGVVTDKWWRKTSRMFDPASGQVTKQQQFWYDDRPNVDERWIALE